MAKTQWFSAGEKIGGAIGTAVGGIVGIGVGIVTGGKGFSGVIPCALAGGGLGALAGDKVEKLISD